MDELESQVLERGITVEFLCISKWRALQASGFKQQCQNYIYIFDFPWRWSVLKCRISQTAVYLHIDPDPSFLKAQNRPCVQVWCWRRHEQQEEPDGRQRSLLCWVDAHWWYSNSFATGWFPNGAAPWLGLKTQSADLILWDKPSNWVGAAMQLFYQNN